MALPYAIAPIPLAAEVADTITSGSVVPIDTTVAPFNISGIWNRSAILLAPSTNQSPPLISRTRPITNKITALIATTRNGHYDIIELLKSDGAK